MSDSIWMIFLDHVCHSRLKFFVFFFFNFVYNTLWISAVKKIHMLTLSPNIEYQKCNKWKQEEDQEGSFKEDSWGVKDGTEGRLGRRLPVERIPEIGRIFRLK